MKAFGEGAALPLLGDRCHAMLTEDKGKLEDCPQVEKRREKKRPNPAFGASNMISTHATTIIPDYSTCTYTSLTSEVL